jgi:hypothetical protein
MGVFHCLFQLGYFFDFFLPLAFLEDLPLDFFELLDFLAEDFPFAPFLGFFTCPPLAEETGVTPLVGRFGAKVGAENVEIFFAVPLPDAPYDVVVVETIVPLSGNELLTYCV